MSIVKNSNVELLIELVILDAAFYNVKPEEPLGYSTTPKCNNCGGESELSRVVSFVDSPGHESLMANMLSGLHYGWELIVSCSK